MVNCTESFRHQKNSILAQFRQPFFHEQCHTPTVHLSPLFFQCGASLISNIAPESTIVKINPPSIDILRTSSSPARRAPTSSFYVIIILCHHPTSSFLTELTRFIRFIRLDSTRFLSSYRPRLVRGRLQSFIGTSPTAFQAYHDQFPRHHHR
jgi:hypothetical protein